MKDLSDKPLNELKEYEERLNTQLFNCYQRMYRAEKQRDLIRRLTETENIIGNLARVRELIELRRIGEKIDE